jgi:hypothetical protein
MKASYYSQLGVGFLIVGGLTPGVSTLVNLDSDGNDFVSILLIAAICVLAGAGLHFVADSILEELDS